MPHKLLCKIFTCVLLSLFLIPPVFAEMKTQKYVLDNGLTVLITEMPASTTVSVYALVKTGSATEGKYLGTGISHFLEHMLFKGTEKRAVGQIAGEVQALGGTINASTSFDYTIYTLNTPHTAFDQSLDIVSDMLMNSKFDAVELDKEREVVYGEMQLYRDRPERVHSELTFATVYKQHPYGVPIIGYEELLRGLKRDDFVDYYRTRYIPDNIVLSIAGNVRTDEILPKVRETFKNFARKPLVLRNLAPEPEQINYRYAEKEYPTDLTRVSIGYAGVSLRDQDMFSLDLFAMLLGQGESSRLYKELFIKKGLVRGVSASNFTPLDRGVFEVELVLDEKDFNEAVKAVKEQIALVAQKGVLDIELEKAKQQIRAQYVFSHLTSDVIANNTAADEAFTGDFDFSRKYVDTINKVSAADIKRVAGQYFKDEKLSITVVKPQKEKAGAESASAAQQTPVIEKVVLDNGLTILLRENPTFPVVSVNLAMNGGTWQETIEKNGVCELVSKLLTMGTKTRSAAEIAQSVESRGASLIPFSGRNSFGLMFNALSDDAGFALDLVEDFIKNPIFAETEIAQEKKKIYTALIAQEDSINAITSRNLRETLFLTHPFRRDGLGTKETVAAITRADIVDFYQRHVVPNNMVLSVFGDIKKEEILPILKKKFGSLTKRDIPVLTYQEAPPEQTREKTVMLDKKQAMVMIAFQGVDLKSPERDGMQVLAAVLGSSFNGRIFKTVRDEFGRAYTLGGGYNPTRDMGMLTFYVLTTDEHADQVKELLVKIFKDVRTKAVADQELVDIKTYLKGSFQMNLETDSSLGFTTALDELYGTGYDYYRSFEQRIDAVTSEDVKDLAVKYLDLNKAAIIISRPARPEGQGTH